MKNIDVNTLRRKAFDAYNYIQMKGYLYTMDSTYEKFLDSEYKNTEIMKSVLGDNLFEVYRQADPEFCPGATVEPLRKSAYEAYKIQWLERISTQRQLDVILNYIQDTIQENEATPSLTLDEYIQEYGYDSELYACYEEFLESEYKDADYMRELLGDELFEAYCQADPECCPKD